MYEKKITCFQMVKNLLWVKPAIMCNLITCIYCKYTHTIFIRISNDTFKHHFFEFVKDNLYSCSQSFSNTIHLNNYICVVERYWEFSLYDTYFQHITFFHILILVACMHVGFWATYKYQPNGRNKQHWWTE